MVTLKNDTTYAFKGWFYYFPIYILLECKVLYITSFRVRKHGKDIYEYKIIEKILWINSQSIPKG